MKLHINVGVLFINEKLIKVRFRLTDSQKFDELQKIGSDIFSCHFEIPRENTMSASKGLSYHVLNLFKLIKVLIKVLRPVKTSYENPKTSKVSQLDY